MEISLIKILGILVVLLIQAGIVLAVFFALRYFIKKWVREVVREELENKK